MKQPFVLMQISHVTYRHDDQSLNIKFIIDLTHNFIDLSQAKEIRNLRLFINHNQFLVSHWFFIEEVNELKHLLFVNCIQSSL